MLQAATYQSVQKAQREAWEVLRDNKMTQAPINVMRLAQALGYEVYEANFYDERISGGVDFGNGKDVPKIYVNRADSPQRQRFTIAHEIGHCLMHKENHKNGILEKIDMFRDPENHSKEEVEANAFAADLLMPAQMVREMWKRWGSTEILADIFKVSLSAMSYRLYNLHLKGDW